MRRVDEGKGGGVEGRGVLYMEGGLKIGLFDVRRAVEEGLPDLEGLFDE